MDDLPRRLAMVALLRGINVSGRRTVAMGDLAHSLEDLGLHDVRTYRQSGNVVFESERASPEEIAAAIERRVAADFGHDVSVLVVPGSVLQNVASSNPFAGLPDVDEGWLHVTFLDRPHAGDCTAEADPPAVDGERATRIGDVVYLLLPRGYARTKLNNAFFEKACGTVATTRSWRTVLALARLLSSM